MKIVLISFTPYDAPGGVPRWNRDFMKGFPGTVHYSWMDYQTRFPSDGQNEPEWNKARILNNWLLKTNRIAKDDLIIVDGFWGLGIPANFNVISVAHGIWSHLTAEDVAAGKKPEFPEHHAQQVAYRRQHLKNGGKIVAVSEFIQRQMSLQWGFKSTVINNAINLIAYRPIAKRKNIRPLIIHGVTTYNKGLDHIEFLKNNLPNVDVLLLDEAAKKLDCSNCIALAHADLVVQPSAYEGNSYFVLETLACGVPIVAYDVGLLETLKEMEGVDIGTIIPRQLRSPEMTLEATKTILRLIERGLDFNPREVAEKFSISNFHEEWKRLIGVDRSSY